MTARYKRVSQSDPEEEESKKIRAERVEKIIAKLHAVFWVAAAIAIIILTDLFNLIHSDKINRFDNLFISIIQIYLYYIRWSFNLTIILFTTNFGIFLYLTIWLPLVLKITIPWDIYCPNMIPISTFLSVLCYVSTIISFWPIWGLLSPLYITVLLFGLVFAAESVVVAVVVVVVVVQLTFFDMLEES